MAFLLVFRVTHVTHRVIAMSLARHPFMDGALWNFLCSEPGSSLLLIAGFRIAHSSDHSILLLMGK